METIYKNYFLTNPKFELKVFKSRQEFEEKIMSLINRYFKVIIFILNFILYDDNNFRMKDVSKETTPIIYYEYKTLIGNFIDSNFEFQEQEKILFD